MRRSEREQGSGGGLMSARGGGVAFLMELFVSGKASPEAEEP